MRWSRLTLLCHFLVKAAALEIAVGAPPLEFTTPGGWQEHSALVGILRSPSNAEIFFTTNGTVPSPTNGFQAPAGWRVTGNAVVRAAAWRAGERVGSVGTLTLLFPEAVARQDGAGFPATWGTKEGRPVPAYYLVDTHAVGSAKGAAQFVEALRALPLLSIVGNPDDLFGAENGIYAHPEESGEAWERAVSVEYSPVDGTRPFAVDCGIRIQGGWNRRPEESPKHSLRLVFRKRHGPRELHYPLFGAGVDRFESLVLRGGNNHSWLHWSGAERSSADYLRDQWMRESYALMGRLSARGRFVHVFLNGLYWGIYNLVERPDEHFAASRSGGAPSDYDARNADKVLSGDEAAWKELFSLANAGITSERDFDAVARLLDLDAFCDYLLLNFYGANADWDAASNWYAIRPRRPDGRFEFIVWDGEKTLEGVDDNRLADDFDQSPLRLFQKLRLWPAFRQRFAARAARLLAADGLLGAEAAGARYRLLAGMLGPAMPAEAARWGDYRHSVHPYKEGPYQRYTVEEHWQPEVTRLLTEYFPRRTEVFIQQLRAAGLYP